VVNFELPLSPGPAVVLGGPLGVPDGQFGRAFSNILFITPTRTLSLDVAVLVDGTGDRCSFNGVAVPS